MSNDEILLNWSNTLRHTNDGVILTAQRQASSLKEKGYSEVEATDLLIADDYEEKIASAAVQSVYRNIVAENLDSPENAFVPYVVPTCYDDVAPIIEKVLTASSPKEFMEKLARSEYPIVANLPDNKFDSFVRTAAAAKESDFAVKVLHKDLMPFVESAMYEAVKLAESNGQRIAGVTDQYEVNLKTGCTCDKYTKGHYAEFGLACEHIVAEAEKVSPNHKMTVTEVDFL